MIELEQSRQQPKSGGGRIAGVTIYLLKRKIIVCNYDAPILLNDNAS